MARTLDGVTIPPSTQITRDTAWLKADRRFLDGTMGQDVTAALKRLKLTCAVTEAQLAVLRAAFFKTSPVRYIDTALDEDCWVFTGGSLKVEYHKVRPSGGIVATAELELYEHGASFAGTATHIDEPATAATAGWTLGGDGIASPQGYRVEYAKQNVTHPCAGGVVWVDTVGISRKWTISYTAMTEAQVDVFRAAQATKVAQVFTSPTDEDSMSVSVQVETVTERLVLGSPLRWAVTVTLTEGSGVAGATESPTVLVELDVDGDGTFDGGVEDISQYVSSVSLDRKSVSEAVGPSGVGGGISHECSITLHHADGLFSPFHADARLTDQFYGKLIRVSLGWGGATDPIFTGRVLSSSEQMGSRRATLLARDLGTFLLQHKRASTTLSQNVGTGAYLATILTLAGMSEGSTVGKYQVDPGNYSIAFAWMDNETFAEELDAVVALEGGRSYWDMAGCFRFEAADHLIGHAVSETLTVAEMTDLQVQWDTDNIANKVQVESTERYVAVSQTVWRAQEQYRIPPSMGIALDCAAGCSTSLLKVTTPTAYGEDALKGEYVRMRTGVCAGEIRKVLHNHATSADVAGDTWIWLEQALSWGTPSAGDHVMLGGIVEVKARFTNPTAGLETLVAWTKALEDAEGSWDYQAITGGGVEATGSLGISVYTTYCASALIYLFNWNMVDALYVQKLDIRGFPLLTRNSQQVEEKDQTSITAYQERDPLILAGDRANLYVQNAVQAKSVAQMLLARFKDPHAIFVLPGLKGVASREIGNRIAITETLTGLSSKEALIVDIKDDYSPGGGWVQTVTAVDAAMIGTTSDGGSDWFIIGASKYGTGAGHGHLWY